MHTKFYYENRKGKITWETKEWMWDRVKMDSSGSGQDLVASSCEHDNKYPGSIKQGGWWGFLDHLSYCLVSQEGLFVTTILSK